MPFQFYKKFWEKYSYLHRYDVMIKNAELKKGDKVVDIGGGPGYLSLYSTKKQCIVYHIDIDPNSIHEAKANAREYDVNEINYIRATAENLQFMQDKVDIVFCGEVLEHLSNDELAIGEVNRILKPSGKYIITTPNYNALPYILLRAMPHKLKKLIIERFRVNTKYFGEDIGEKTYKKEDLGHIRSGYTKKELELKLILNGFEIKKSMRFGVLIPDMIASKMLHIFYKIVYEFGGKILPIASVLLIVAKKKN